MAKKHRFLRKKKDKRHGRESVARQEAQPQVQQQPSPEQAQMMMAERLQQMRQQGQ